MNMYIILHVVTEFVGVHVQYIYRVNIKFSIIKDFLYNSVGIL